MTTVPELLRRVRDTSIAEVVNAIAGDADEAQDFVRVVGPIALNALLLQNQRANGVAAPAPRAVSAPRVNWNVRMWEERLHWLEKMYKGVNDEYRFTARIVKAFDGDANLTTADVFGRLAPEDQERAQRLCGVKRLVTA